MPQAAWKARFQKQTNKKSGPAMQSMGFGYGNPKRKSNSDKNYGAFN
jgi:hypothetical protein